MLMIRYQVTIPMWLDLPQELRSKMVEIFALKRSGGTVISSVGGVMRCETDGYTHEDLIGISIDKMQDFLGEHDEKDFWKLLEATINKAEEGLPTAPKEKAPWCDSCDSKGVRHKKICPKVKKLEVKTA